jgi:hypothetical protein
MENSYSKNIVRLALVGLFLIGFIAVNGQIGLEYGNDLTSISPNKTNIFKSELNTNTQRMAIMTNGAHILFAGFGVYTQNYNFKNSGNLFNTKGLYVPVRLNAPIQVYHNRQIGRRCRYADFNLLTEHSTRFLLAEAPNSIVNQNKFQSQFTYGMGLSMGTSKFYFYSSVTSSRNYGKPFDISKQAAKQKGFGFNIGLCYTPEYDFTIM